MVSGEVKQHFSGRIEDKKGSCSKMKKTKYVRTFFLCSVILWTLLVSGSDCRDLGKTLRATQSETKQLLRKKRDSGMATPSGISQGLPSMSLNSHGQRGEAPSVAKSGKDIFKQLLLQSRESESVMALVNSEDALSLSLGRRGHPGSSLHEVESDQTETKQLIRKRRELDIETDPKLFEGKLSSVPTTPRQNGGLRNILKSGGDNMKPLLRKIRESESLPASVSSADVSSSSPAGKGNSTQNAQSAKPIKIRDHMGPSASYSIITQSILTFVTVFVFGCAVILAVFAWKRFTDSSFRVPLPYQYSALSQFDQDPDEDLHDLEDNLHMLVEDSSSEDDAEDRKVCGERIKGGSNGIGKAGGVHSNLEKAEDRVEIDDEDGDDDVFPEEDCNAPATLPVSENTETTASINAAAKNGRPSISSLLDESDDENLIPPPPPAINPPPPMLKRGSSSTMSSRKNSEK